MSKIYKDTYTSSPGLYENCQVIRSTACSLLMGGRVHSTEFMRWSSTCLQQQRLSCKRRQPQNNSRAGPACHADSVDILQPMPDESSVEVKAFYRTGQDRIGACSMTPAAQEVYELELLDEHGDSETHRQRDNVSIYDSQAWLQ